MMLVHEQQLLGERFEIHIDDEMYPESLRRINKPPKCLRVVGNPAALKDGLSIVGARKATPYGISLAKHFARLAAEKGIVIISGGARGCDAAAHEGALKCNGQTVVFLGGGCDVVYPPENFELFQRIVNAGGAIVSEQDWTFRPMKFTFRARNRLIAGLARATLIVEAGLPSGTFSTADAALEAGKEVLAVPGSISSPLSAGSNRLIYQGATPIVDDDIFYDQLFSIYGCLLQEDMSQENSELKGYLKDGQQLLRALEAQPLSLDDMCKVASECKHEGDTMSWLMMWLAKATKDGYVAQYPDGRYGPTLISSAK